MKQHAEELMARIRALQVANRAPLEPPNRGLMEPAEGVEFRVSDGCIFSGFLEFWQR